MKQFDGVLICTDLDGTLLKNDKTISDENVKAIEFFKENGGLFTFVTGRVPVTVDNICKMINPNISIGCVNGGGVYNYEEKEYQWLCALDSDVTELLECVGLYLSSGLHNSWLVSFQVLFVSFFFSCSWMPSVIMSHLCNNK